MKPDVIGDLKEVASKGTLKTLILYYGVGFVVALAALGIAFTYGRENGQFNWKGYATGVITPVFIKVIVKWLQSRGVGEGVFGGIDRVLSASVALTVVLMFAFDAVVRPTMQAEALRNPAGDGVLASIFFGIPGLINKEKAAAARIELLGSAPAGAPNPAPNNNSANPSDQSTNAGSTGGSGGSASGSVADQVKGVISEVFDSLEPAETAGVGRGVGSADRLWLEMQE